MLFNQDLTQMRFLQSTEAPNAVHQLSLTTHQELCLFSHVVLNRCLRGSGQLLGQSFP